MNTMPQSQRSFTLSEDQDIPFISSSPILNETLLAQYEAMDEGVTEDPLLPKLVGIFQKHMPDHLKRLDTGLKTQDETEVTYVIHKMLGMAHNVGALRLSDFLMILENSEADVKLSLTRADVKVLDEEFQAAAAALEEFMNEGRSADFA